MKIISNITFHAIPWVIEDIPAVCKVSIASQYVPDRLLVISVVGDGLLHRGVHHLHLPHLAVGTK